jgi:hypothetical protein
MLLEHKTYWDQTTGDTGGGAGAASAAPPPPAAAAAPAAPPAAAPTIPAAPAAASAEPVIAAGQQPAVTIEDQRKYLAEKVGGKPEELAKLSEADLRKQYDEAKSKEGQPPALKAEDIKITVPQGIEIDEPQMNAFKALIADAKLTPIERAQKLIDMHVAALKSTAEAPLNLWNETQAKWQGEVKADPEIGGQNFDRMRSTIAKAITEVGGKEAEAIFEALRYTGAANNPAIVRAFFRMSARLVEGGPVVGGALASGKGRTFAERIQGMYPSASDGIPAT